MFKTITRENITKLSLAILVLTAHGIISCAIQPTKVVPVDEQYDLVEAIPGGNINTAVTELQKNISVVLNAIESSTQPGLYQIKRKQWNLTTNRLPNKPYEPHISLKGIPVEKRQLVRNIITPEIFENFQIPQNIRLTGLLVIRGFPKATDPTDKLFIVADFLDNPRGSFDSIAQFLDGLTDIPRPAGQQYLHHITLAKIWPQKNNPNQKINDTELDSIHRLLADLYGTLKSGPLNWIFNTLFPINRIDYSEWQVDPTLINKTDLLWPVTKQPATHSSSTAAPTPYIPAQKQQPSQYFDSGAASSSRLKYQTSHLLPEEKYSEYELEELDKCAWRTSDWRDLMFNSKYLNKKTDKQIVRNAIESIEEIISDLELLGPSARKTELLEKLALLKRKAESYL